MMRLSDLKKVEELVEYRTRLIALMYQAVHGVAHNKTEMKIIWRICGTFPQGGQSDLSKLLDTLELDGPYMALVRQQIHQKIEEVEAELIELGVELWAGGQAQG